MPDSIAAPDLHTLDRIADLAGIKREYWDIFGTHHPTTEEAKISLLTAMGYDVSSADGRRAALEALDLAPWRRGLGTEAVIRLGWDRPRVAIYQDAQAVDHPIDWTVKLEDGRTRQGRWSGGDVTVLRRRDLEDGRRLQLSVPLPDDLPMGYHRLVVGDAECPLIAAPGAAWMPSALRGGQRRWGLAAHLYSLQRRGVKAGKGVAKSAVSEGDWGIGDFTTLAVLGRQAGALGADMVGVNPLHALFPGRPDHASPYYPCSRQFLNVLYIDVTAVPEHDGTTPDSALAMLRAGRLVDYPRVWKAKLAAFEVLWRRFKEHAPDHPRRGAFETFRRQGGPALERFCLYHALREHFDNRCWMEWPKPFHDPQSKAVTDFARENADRNGLVPES